MIIFEVLASALTSILISYLAFTNALAVHVETYLLPLSAHTDTTIPPTQTDDVSTTEPSEKLSLLSRMYAQAGGIPKILKENSAFQEAARAASQHANVIDAVSENLPLDVRVTNSLVNIFCEYRTNEYIKTTTGTGFFINSSGVILTNAHVAQFLLLEGVGGEVKRSTCVIRAGNPATPRYIAELLFISPTWISHNAQLIAEETPRGTGEYDYALLYVSETIDNTELPTVFPALPIDTDFLPRSLTGREVLTAGYPAEKLFREGAKAELIPKVASTSVRELYTFGSNYADIFSVSASDVGEQGASGGPIATQENGAIGLIVTKGDELTDGVQSLRALTLSYIDRTIQEETGFSLIENAQGNLINRGNIFKEALAPYLAQLLEYEL